MRRPFFILVHLTCVSRELHPRRTFRISRARRTAVRNVFIRLEHDGVIGYGEASPNAFYDETWEGVIAKLESARDFLAALQIHSIAEIEAAWTEAWKFLAPSRAAQCALDLALWDWLARQQKTSVAEMVWREPPKPVVSFATIGLSEPAEWPEKIGELRGFPRIKVKSDAAANLDLLRLLRAEESRLIAVDANCAWADADFAALSRELATLGVAFIEQPFPPTHPISPSRADSALPIIADESCVTEEDLPRVLDGSGFAGFNIKLVKCGGLTPALRMLARGRAAGRTIMVGCMLESSALIAAGAVLAQRTDYADLDGAWLLGDDPFSGWNFERGVLHPPTVFGLGIEPIAGLFP